MVIDCFANLIILNGVIISAPAACKAAQGDVVFALNWILMNGSDEQIKRVVEHAEEGEEFQMVLLRGIRIFVVHPSIRMVRKRQSLT